MRFYNGQHRYYCGIDLHAKTMYGELSVGVRSRPWRAPPNAAGVVRAGGAAAPARVAGRPRRRLGGDQLGEPAVGVSSVSASV